MMTATTTTATTDPYHSRDVDVWAFGSRVDPVVWGELPGPLTAEDRARFAVDGFLVAPALFTPDEVGALLAEAHTLAARDDLGEALVSEPDSDAVRSIFRVHAASATYAGLAADRRLAGVARQLLGSDVYVHQSRINFKPGFHGRAFNWHSDFETWHVEDGMPRMRAVSAAICLTENVAVNGPLLLVPGSHTRFVRCVGATPEAHYKQSLRDQRYGVPEDAALRQLIADGGVVQALGPPGTVVFFDCNTMHGSSGNPTPYPRHNVFFVFNSVENRLVAPFGGRAPRPDFIAERDPAARAG